MARPFRVPGVASSWEPSSSGELSNPKYSLLPSASSPSVFLLRSKYIYIYIYTYVQVVFRDTVLHSIVGCLEIKFSRDGGKKFSVFWEKRKERERERLFDKAWWRDKDWVILQCWTFLHFNRLEFRPPLSLFEEKFCTVFLWDWKYNFWKIYLSSNSKKGKNCNTDFIFRIYAHHVSPFQGKDSKKKGEGLNSIFETPFPPKLQGGRNKEREGKDFLITIP